MSEQARPSAWVVEGEYVYGDGTFDIMGDFFVEQENAEDYAVNTLRRATIRPLYTEAAAYELAARNLEKRAKDLRGYAWLDTNASVVEGRERIAKAMEASAAHLRSLHTTEDPKNE